MATDLTNVSAEEERTKPAPGERPGRAARAPSLGEGRLVSLDTFRGFIMFWIVGGHALIASLLALRPNALSNFLLNELGHSVWAGLHFWDCIWPSFMLMVGVSIPFSYAKRSCTQTYPQMLGHALIRFAALFLLSSLRESVDGGKPAWIELSGVLQPIAIAYLVAFLLVRMSPWIQAAVGGAILAANLLIMAFVSAPGVPAGSYQESANIIRSVDLMVLGRTYLPGNTGGVGGSILCIWFPIPTTILGMLIGGWLLSARSKASKMKMIAGAGFLCLAGGYALSFFVPVIFKLVTPSFVLVSAGWACLMLLIFYYAVDYRGFRKWTLPFIVIGSNSIFVYMFYDLVPLHRWVSIFTRAAVAPGGRLEPLLHAVVFLAVEWLLLFWMYRRKIFIKA